MFLCTVGMGFDYTFIVREINVMKPSMCIFIDLQLRLLLYLRLLLDRGPARLLRLLQRGQLQTQPVQLIRLLRRIIGVELSQSGACRHRKMRRFAKAVPRAPAPP